MNLCSAVNFQEYGGGRVHSIAGSFPIVDPWWAAKISVSQHSVSFFMLCLFYLWVKPTLFMPHI